MEVVLFHFDNPFSRPLVRNIVKKLGGVSAIHNFWSLPVNYGAVDKLENTTVHERFNEVIALFKNDYNVLDFSRMAPLDKEAIKSMAEYENECKKIINRYTSIFPAFTRGNQNGIYKLIDQWYCHLGNRYSSNSMPVYDLNVLYLRVLRYWFDFFEHNKIDLILAEFVPHGFEYIGYRVAQKLKIPVVFSYFTHSTMFQYFMSDFKESERRVIDVMSDLKKTTVVQKINLNPVSEREWKRLNEPADKQSYPWGGDLKKIEELERLLSKNEKELKNFVIKNHPSVVIKYNLFIKFLIRLSNLLMKSPWGRKAKFEVRQGSYYEELCTQADFSSSFVYFPLHYQPEATSLPLGDVFENQLLVVQMINYHLPPGWYLYVKEHNIPSDQNNRPLDFYNELLKNDKVRLISKKTSTFALIEHCKATVTLTGTAGWEGIFKGKPCLFFGHHISKYAPGIFSIRTNQDCSQAIQAIQDGVTISMDDLKYFMKALEGVSVPTSSERFTYIQKDMSEAEWLEIMTKGYLDKIRNVLSELTTHKQVFENG